MLRSGAGSGVNPLKGAQDKTAGPEAAGGTAQ